MSLRVNKESGVVYNPVFLQILEDIPGGVTIRTDRFKTTTQEIKKGALLHEDLTSVGLYNVVKTAKVIHAVASDATIMYVDPRNEFVVGEYIGGFGTVHAPTILTITPGLVSNAVLLKSKPLKGVASGAILFEGAVAATNTPLYVASAVLRDTVEVRRDGVTTLLDNLFAGAVVRGTVDESEMPYFVTAADKVALTARIRFA